MKKILSLALCVLMLVSVLPMTAGAVTDGWETLTFSQNGPVFSVKATGFEAADANDTFAFTAVAYKGESEKVDEKTVPVTITDGELAANVNFEDGGEADVAINKVTNLFFMFPPSANLPAFKFIFKYVIQKHYSNRHKQKTLCLYR